MYGFWRLGLSPLPSAGAAIVVERARDRDEQPREGDRDPAEDGRHPDDEVARAPSREPDRERRVRR